MSVGLELGLDDDGLRCGGGEEVLGFAFFSFLTSRLPVLFRAFPSWRGDGGFLVDGLCLRLLLLLLDEAAESDDECPLRRFELVDVVTTVSLDGVLPKRRDNWSNVLRVSDREAFERSLRDS